MPTIDLEAAPATPRRPRLPLQAPIGAALLVVGLLLGALLTRGAPASVAVAAPSATPAAEHIQADISTWPAVVTAIWWDAAGQRHQADNWTRVRLDAVRVVVVVTSDKSPIECTLTINGQVVDDHTAPSGHVAVCAWAASAG